MLGTQIIGGATNERVTRSVVDFVTVALSGAKLQVQCREYRQAMTLEGQKVLTGRKTIVIEIDDGDPDLQIEYLAADCCGG